MAEFAKARKYTIIKILSTIVLATAITGMPTLVSAFELPEYVTVGLRYGNTAVNLAEIKTDNGLSFGLVENNEFIEISDLEENTAVRATVVDDGIQITDSDGNVLEIIEKGSKGCILPQEEDDIIRFNEARYRGGIMLIQDGNDKITVINRLAVDEYLYGVLNQEMSESNPLEALKAQAIAARNFVAIRLYSHSEYGFGVCTTTHCQVYKGYDGETEKTNQAVDETSGLLMYSNDLPVQAYYHKNSGGFTENSENVWYAQLSYLRAVEDPYSPSYPWSLTLSFDEIRASLEDAGYDPGKVVNVEIMENTDTGGVFSLMIKGEDSTIVLQKEKVRSIFGSTKVKSTLFNINSDSESGLTIQSSDSKIKADSSLFVISRDGAQRSVNRNNLFVSDSNGAISKFSAAVSNGTLTMTGTGYGHRVGMSQDGAIEMAQKGYAFEEILEFYYKGVEIK